MLIVVLVVLMLLACAVDNLPAWHSMVDRVRKRVAR